VNAFLEYSTRKAREAAGASIRPLLTIDDRSASFAFDRIGNDWTRHLYGGDFHLAPLPNGRPAVSLVFVQSRDGNTGAAHPDSLGGGPTDKHLIYEGLSRVAADGVLSGASTAAGRRMFFSVWHPELVALRQELGRPRHPAQIILSKDGNLNPDRTLLFNVPDVPVFILAGPSCVQRCRAHVGRRPWITVIPLEGGGLDDALTTLRRDHGIERISCIGGRRAATSLIDLGLVQDLYLTTTPREAGEPGTPFYVGQHSPAFDLIVRKRELETGEPIEFEHLGIGRA
jgi:5-amino-6-(5-phosphoribosylamino)uracil reductase